MGHTLSLREFSPYPSRKFCCNLCQTEGCGPVYHCSDCDFDIHVACAAVNARQTHFSHSHHPLHLSQYLGPGLLRRTCSSCGSDIRTWSFRCSACNFDIHSMCARAPRSIVHPRHPDPLVLTKASDVPGCPNVFCNGCKMPATDLFYRCRPCSYNLHQACATLPTEIKHVKHRAHVLTLVDQPPQILVLCAECRERVDGWHFHCVSCEFNLHPRCTKVVHELPHVNSDGDQLHAHGQSNGTILEANTSVAHNLSHVIGTPLISNIGSHTIVPSQSDWEVVERVLRFSKEMAKVHDAKEAALKKLEEEQEDVCPTCLEGFTLANPKRTTSCGHHFHLPCILAWMEQSSNCPLCRKTFNLVV